MDLGTKHVVQDNPDVSHFTRLDDLRIIGKLSLPEAAKGAGIILSLPA
jgi:hypothetical protein